MRPDDPRHGTHAGIMAHWRAGKAARYYKVGDVACPTS